jgi:hypothetical protein
MDSSVSVVLHNSILDLKNGVVQTIGLYVGLALATYFVVRLTIFAIRFFFKVSGFGGPHYKASIGKFSDGGRMGMVRGTNKAGHAYDDNFDIPPKMTDSEWIAEYGDPTQQGR